MHRILFGALTLGLLLIPCRPVRADDPAEAGAIIDQAIKAAGGKETLEKFPGACMKVKGTLTAEDQKLSAMMEFCYAGQDRARTVTTTEDKDSKSTEIKVVNGDNGWIKTDDRGTVPLSTEELAAEKDSLYLNEVTMLAPLTGKAFTLTPLGKSTVDGRPALGVKVSHKGQRDIKLFFDKKDWLLLKTERTVKDADGDKDATEEVFFQDYKAVQGIQIPLKMTVKNNGKTTQEMEITECKFLEHPDDQLFTRP